MEENKMTPQQIQLELRRVIDQALLHREALQSLEQRRLSLIAQLKQFSSSIASVSVVSSPGVIQGPPPGSDKNE